MKTRDEMVITLDKFCDNQEDCSCCLLEKFSDDCNFNRWPDDKLAIAYDHVYKNSEARLDDSHREIDDDGHDMVSHP